MTQQSSATLSQAPVVLQRSGLAWGLLGVTAFSFTLPFTSMAVAGGMSPMFVGSARAVLAAVLAAAALVLTRQHLPQGVQWLRLAVVAAGVVAGFPLLTSFALETAPAGHGAVVIGLLPAATAVAVVIRTREQPPRAFWVAAGVGALAAMLFALAAGGGVSGLHWPDLLLFLAVVAGAVGYAEGGLLSRELGAWQTISWALVVAAPLMVVLAGTSVLGRTPTGTPGTWAAFAYLGVVSMFLGFFAWYRGLSIGPMTRVSQVQLVQPVMTICWAALLLDERVTWLTVVGGVTVIACAAGAVVVRSSNRDARRESTSK
ncbi:DMT family transporter [Rhodococcoides yunnanense]|uniref:DMT family transporter n=1 Tax=Rhodococcoides yunnanense TaxID=278209 RepID=UPI0022B0EEAE|nr:DMT family transporter [Rhodococcus yunnanensis]MCZ4277535.1 DMT family transporter [Rhodococcus yunnanensis]